MLAPARCAGPAVANGRAKLVLMPSHVQPRRIIINGHPTSVRLESAYWGWLREIAAECGMTAKAFIEGVVAAKDPKCPLASALRLYIANYFRSSAPRYGLVDPASRLARSGSTTPAKNRDSREHHRTLSHPRWSRLATRPRTLRHYRNPVTELALSCAPNASAWYASDFLTTYP